MHEVAGAIPEIMRKEPNTMGATFAIGAALDMLNSARERFEHREYKQSFAESKDAIRMAASALLLRDGYVASTMEATVNYLSEKYPDKLPVEEWQDMENFLTGNGHGLLNLLLKLLGKQRETSEEEARAVLAIAEKFLLAIGRIVELGR